MEKITAEMNCTCRNLVGLICYMSILRAFKIKTKKSGPRVAAILKTAILSIKLLQIEKITLEMTSACAEM